MGTPGGVVNEGEEQVLANVAHRRHGELARPHDALQVALQQRDAGALDGDVGAGAHGDADVGGGERRCVVDAVAGHGDDAAFPPKLVDDGAFLVGQHLGLDLADAETARDGLRGRAVVAGEHDDADAVGAQGFERGLRRCLHRIGDGDDGGRLAVDADKDRGGPVSAQLVGFRGERARVDPQLLEETCIAERHALAVDGAERPLAGGRVEIAGRAERNLAPFGCRDDGGGKRVLARPLDAGREPQHRRFVEAGCRHDGGHRRSAFRQRTGLVDDQRVDLFQALQSLGILDEHAGFGAAPDADHDGHRRGEAERARAGDDQHRHGSDERVGEARLRAPDHPRDKRR